MDLTVIDEKFLANMEQSLLLGQNSFKGLNDSRLALKLSNMLYKSKGTRFSVEQFFRIFFGEEVEVVYTKENVFIVNESEIGFESLRYIIDDKLYQTFAILIKTGIAIAEWIDLYKLFVHPAGIYVGGQVLLSSVARVWPGPPTAFMPFAEDDNTVIATDVEALATMGTALRPTDNVTAFVFDSVGTPWYRISLQNTIDMYDSVTVGVLDTQYNNIGEIMSAHSPTFDMDSVAPDLRTIKVSNTFETMDQYAFKYLDSV
jgi:hypothetical protein